jgi:hypothetical protein
MLRSGSRTRQIGAVTDLNMISACHSYIGQVCTQFMYDINTIGTIPDVFNGRQRLAETQLTGKFLSTSRCRSNRLVISCCQSIADNTNFEPRVCVPTISHLLLPTILIQRQFFQRYLYHKITVKFIQSYINI